MFSNTKISVSTPRSKFWIKNAISLVTVMLIGYLSLPIARWAIVDAAFIGTQPQDCHIQANASEGVHSPAEKIKGACWPAVWANLRILFFYHYPVDQQWRAISSFIMLCAFVVFLLKGKLFSGRGIALGIALPIAALLLLRGGFGPLPYVSSSKWGGFVLTITLSVFAVLIAFPIGLGLALARRSKMPVIRFVATGWIELIRGVPLISLLFTAHFILPLFLPASWSNFDPLLRAETAMIIFGAAYIAEVIRGGLQTIPKGQFEASHALGLSYWHSTGLIILPQALKVSIPPLISTFIGLMKDTTLVSVIGIFDLLGAAREIPANPQWLGRDIEILIFACFIYWCFCFGLSKYGLWLERQLATTKA